MSGQKEDKSDKRKNKDIRIKNIDNNIYVQEFEELWKTYPKKQGKTNAQKSYIKARKEGTSKEQVEKGLQNYVNYIDRNKIEQRYIKMGSTWFNQKCWEDSYDDNGRNKNTKGAKDGTSKDEGELDWFFH